MEMAVRSMETAERAMETNGDGSGDTSPSQQGARTETSVPQNWSSMAAVLRNCCGNFAYCSRVFASEASYRRSSDVRSRTRWSHHRWARPGAGPRPLVVRLAPGPPPTLFWSSSFVREK
jgi:hypothetical protein